MSTISNQKNISNADQQRQSAIQSWHEPALALLSEMHQRCCQRLWERGRDTKNAAVHKEEFRQELAKRHKLYYSYAHEIERSLVKSRRVTYMGQNYLVRMDGDV